VTGVDGAAVGCIIAIAGEFGRITEASFLFSRIWLAAIEAGLSHGPYGQSHCAFTKPATRPAITAMVVVAKAGWLKKKALAKGL
jgi:hypothetical protein